MENLIYDRIQSDVDNKTLKGRHRVEDLNRVEAWCNYLAELLTNYGYVVRITTKTNWAITDMRYASEIERIRTNIGKIKNAYYTLVNTPQLPETLNKITWQKANAIEKILHDIDVLIGNMEAGFRYCGTFNVGGDFEL